MHSYSKNHKATLEGSAAETTWSVCGGGGVGGGVGGGGYIIVQ